MKTARSWLILVGACLVPACHDDAVSPEDGSPTACHTAFVFLQSPPCSWSFWFKVDPTCSVDDTSPREDLSVRWDFDDDGEWDTGFGPLEARFWEPDCLVEPLWTSRCRVRDADGREAESVYTVDLSRILPTAPDIIADALRVSFDACSAPVETVFVGQEFGMMVFETCWMECEDLDHKIAFLIDGQVVSESSNTCKRPFWCTPHGERGFVLDEPGIYELSAFLDAEDVVQETDESNNRAVTTLVVVPGPVD